MEQRCLFAHPAEANYVTLANTVAPADLDLAQMRVRSFEAVGMRKFDVEPIGTVRLRGDDLSRGCSMDGLTDFGRIIDACVHPHPFVIIFSRAESRQDGARDRHGKLRRFICKESNYRTMQVS